MEIKTIKIIAPTSEINFLFPLFTKLPKLKNIKIELDSVLSSHFGRYRQVAINSMIESAENGAKDGRYSFPQVWFLTQILLRIRSK